MPARRPSPRARVLATAICAVALALSAIAAPVALAGGPAGGEYKLHGPNAGTGVGDSGGGSGGVVLLIAGAVVVAGAGALVYVKRRGNTGEAT